MAERFSLPRDVLLVLNEDEDIEPLLETDARLERALAARRPRCLSSGIGFLLPSAANRRRRAGHPGRRADERRRAARHPDRRRDGRGFGRTRSSRFSSACRACWILTRGSRTTGSWPTASNPSSRSSSSAGTADTHGHLPVSAAGPRHRRPAARSSTTSTRTCV